MAESTEDTNSVMCGDDSPTKSIVVLYHANCLDGFGAAYAAWTKLGNTADYIPVQYGDKIDATNYWGKGVYIVDFSYCAADLIKLEAYAEFVVVIDHHKTALPQLEQTLEALDAQDENEVDMEHCFSYKFSNDKSGAVLTWEYFHPNKPVPDLLLHIQDRDLWQFELDGTKELCQAIADRSIYPRVFMCWDNIDVQYAISKGRILLRNFQARCQSLTDKAYRCNICTYDVPFPDGTKTDRFKGLAINAPAEYASEVGNLLAIKSGTYGAVWSYWGAGKYQVSLRSIGDYDVSVIAKYYGGGGHKNAAGFIVAKPNSLDFFSLIQDLTDETNKIN